MLWIAWANVRGHLLRTFATALSVVFGVAFVTGTFVFTDTVHAAFERLFGSTVEGADLIVSAADTGRSDADAARGGVPPDLVATLNDTPGVADAEPRFRGLAKLARDDGTALGGFGALLQGLDSPRMPGAVELRTGALPTADDEIAIDAASAAELDSTVGDRVMLLLNGPAQPYRVSGIVEPPALADLAGSTTVVFTDDVAQRLYGRDGATYLAVRAADGTDPAALRDRITQELGTGLEVLTVDELVNDSVSQVGDFLGFLTRGLLVFAGAALLVGAIIIFNTFGITVAQRTRELALVQAIGADNRQIMRAVLIEAFIVGSLGSAIGVAVGVIGAVALRALLRVVELPLPSTGLVVVPRTVVLAVAVGLVVTIVAAIGPALRAGHRAPVDALRAASAGTRVVVSTPRLVAGSLSGGIAAAVLIGTGLDRGGLVALAVGAATLTLAIVLLAPLGAGPLTALIGLPIRAVRRLPGLLARANAVRNPGRTAATATALLIGLALVTFVLILVSSFRSSLDRVIVEQFRADYQLQAVDQIGYPTAVTDRAGEIEGVDLVSAAKVTRGEVNGASRTVFAVDAMTLPTVYNFRVFEGSLDKLDEGGVAVSRKLNVPLGAKVAVQVGSSGAADAREVVALTDDLHLPGTTRVGQALVDVSTAGAAVAGQQDLVAFVKLAADADQADVRRALEDVVAEQPDVRVADTAELRAQVRDQTDRLLGLVIGLVLLSVIVSFVGVVNALGLSVVERAGELGLLQALGMTQQQARQMVRWESVIITVLGTVVGVAIGLVFGWLGVRVLRDEGLTAFSVPTEQIVIAVVVMLIAGIFASVLPARRASQVDVLRAVTVE
ncbi:MAG: FtsX-like permease family protein [Actinobacteria bacterium]|nr:FtsX-like permease family protein [Actinomycetota bacterium]